MPSSECKVEEDNIICDIDFYGNGVSLLKLNVDLDSMTASGTYIKSSGNLLNPTGYKIFTEFDNLECRLVE